MKKIFAIMIAVFLAVAMIIPVAAAPNDHQHTITITNADPAKKHTYIAYRIFEGNLDHAEQILSDINWSNGITSGQLLLTRLKSQDFNPTSYTDFEDCSTAAAVAEVLVGYRNNSIKLDAFASVVGTCLNTTSGVAGTSTENASPYHINVTGDGYYFIKDKNSTVTDPGETYSKYMLNVVSDVSIEAKDDHNVVDKDIIGADGVAVDANSASIGDTITYRTTIAIPEMDGYKAYTFTMSDTLSKGLTFQGITSVVVGESHLTADTDTEQKDYAVSAVKNADGTTSLTVDYHDFIQYKGTEGDVVVTYTAVLNDEAELGKTGNPNTVRYIYSNNPSSTGEGNPGTTGVTPDSTVVTYTTGIEILKVDDEDNTILLEGAKFKIEGEGVNIIVSTGTKFEESSYVAQEGETIDADVYYKLEDGSYTKVAPDPVPDVTYVLVHYRHVTQATAAAPADATTGPDGKANFNGLGAGQYIITELEAPDGYNLLDHPVHFGINWTADKGFTLAAGSTQGVTVDANTKTFKVTIENRTGSVLPNTGGIGTTIFMIVGGVMILGAAVVLVSVLVSRKRTSK